LRRLAAKKQYYRQETMLDLLVFFNFFNSLLNCKEKWLKNTDMALKIKKIMIQKMDRTKNSHFYGW